MSRHVAVARGRGAEPLPWSSLEELIQDAARRRPHDEAFRDEGHQSLTFVEVDDRTSRTAKRLLSLGLQPGERVGLMLGNGLSWPIAWLAIVRAGGVAVPINKNYQSTDLTYVLRDSETSIVLADADTRSVVTSALSDAPTVRLVCGIDIGLSDPLPIWEQRTGTAPLAPGPWEGVANLQYTSGTTGFPKACVLSERYWLRAGWVTAEISELGRDDTVLTTQPFSYIDPQWQTIMCLIAGATLVVMPRFSARGYWPAVREHRVTFAYVLGTMPTILFKQEPSPADRQHSVRLILCSGIPVALHNAFEERWGMPWREAYGLTETAIDLAVPASATQSVGSGIAGCVVATKEARVVGEDGTDILDDRTGELWVRGEPMMSRYHGRPDETAEAMVDGWLRTGDLVRRDSHGWISVVGRLKDMVRRAGENISAAEVEAVINTHPAVMMAAVVAVPDPVVEEEVKVFVQLHPTADQTGHTAHSIVDHARDQLAGFKVPRFLEFVNSFELTPSERVIKASLRRSDQRSGSFDSKGNQFSP